MAITASTPFPTLPGRPRRSSPLLLRRLAHGLAIYLNAYVRYTGTNTAREDVSDAAHQSLYT